MCSTCIWVYLSSALPSLSCPFPSALSPPPPHFPPKLALPPLFPFLLPLGAHCLPWGEGDGRALSLSLSLRFDPMPKKHAQQTVAELHTSIKERANYTDILPYKYKHSMEKRSCMRSSTYICAAMIEPRHAALIYIYTSPRIGRSRPTRWLRQ